MRKKDKTINDASNSSMSHTAMERGWLMWTQAFHSGYHAKGEVAGLGVRYVWVYLSGNNACVYITPLFVQHKQAHYFVLFCAIIHNIC